MITKPQVPLPTFQTGQIWEVDGMTIQIGTVGKTLVHSKRYKNKPRGGATSLNTKIELESYLRRNNATLVQQ